MFGDKPQYKEGARLYTDRIAVLRKRLETRHAKVEMQLKGLRAIMDDVQSLECAVTGGKTSDETFRVVDFLEDADKAMFRVGEAIRHLG